MTTEAHRESPLRTPSDDPSGHKNNKIPKMRQTIPSNVQWIARRTTGFKMPTSHRMYMQAGYFSCPRLIN